MKLAGEKFNVTICGRNADRGEQVVAAMRANHSHGEFQFLRTDAFSLQFLAQTCRSFRAKHNRLDLLVLTQGMATIQGYTPTDSGLDQKLVLHHFGRMACILELLDLLNASAQNGADVRVLSVLSAGVHSPFKQYKKDPILRNNYSISNAANFAGFAQDLCLDACARENPSLTFVHAAPGFVRTSWGTELPSALRWAVRGMQRFAKSEESCADTMVGALLNRDLKGGLRLISPCATPAPKTSLHSDEAVSFMWSATKDAIMPHLKG